MGIYLFSRDVLLDILTKPGIDFGKEIIPAALTTHRVHAYFFRGYWADVGTIASFYDANIMLTQPDPPFTFFHPHAPIYTHQRFLPGTRFINCRIDSAIVCDGCSLDSCTIHTSVVGIRTMIRRGATITRSVLLGADLYDGSDGIGHTGQGLGIGRDVVLDRVVVDKNARIGDGARLTNASGVDRADGDGYYIRDGIIIVPKAATIPPGTVV
jgi:glucose-1-phosphate adenylyltransferase